MVVSDRACISLIFVKKPLKDEDSHFTCVTEKFGVNWLRNEGNPGILCISMAACF